MYTISEIMDWMWIIERDSFAEDEGIETGIETGIEEE